MFFLRTLLVLTGCIALSAEAQTSGLAVTQTIGAQTLAPGGSSVALNLANYIGLPGVTGQIVQFDTVEGKFDVELRADAAPKEVANFLGYVQRGDYANSFFHRSASLDATGAISIVQGGGYVATSSGISQIAAQAPVPLEYNLPNARGTLAAARSSDINSATSQWYFNVRDNSSILGPSNGGGYTVFGDVLGSGMSVVDAIAALPRVNAGSPFDALPVRNYTSGTVQNSNLVIVNSITVVPMYPTAGGSSVITFAVQNSAPNVVSTTLSGATLTLTPVAAGTADVTVQATDVNGNTVNDSFTVNVVAVAPSFTSQPQSQTIEAGNTVVLNATATAANSYRWMHNGAAINGATDGTLVINNAGAADAGSYTVTATNSIGSVTSNAATITIVNDAPANVGRLVNLSIRSNAGTGDQTLIVGFNLGGSGTSGSAPLLLRGVGPSLAPYGVTNFLPDPVITLYTGQTAISTNDNWGGNAQIAAEGSQVGAFPLPSGSLDAALAVSPATGGYTMQVTGNGSTGGTALAEIYDATPAGSFTAATPRLINVSARTAVGTGEGTLIVGFTIGGSTSKTVLIRATGPGLATFGVSGTLADPVLTLIPQGSSTPIATNDNWGGDPHIVAAAASVGAFPLTDGSSKDAALLITLPPGGYTAQVTGADGGTGVALVEVYEVP